MAYDKVAYNIQRNKEKTKVKSVRYMNNKAERIEAYCKYKNMGFSELVNMLIEREIEKDGWTYVEGEK